jgi:cytoskeletal protein RodZ
VTRPPGDPNYPDDNPTEYLGQPPEEPVPWYRKPAALVAFGALGALLVALIVWGLASLITGGDEPTERTTLTPLTTTSRTFTTVTQAPQTITETVTPSPTATTTTTTEPTTTTTTTTTEPTTSVSTSVSTSTETSTVTETVTAPPSP